MSSEEGERFEEEQTVEAVEEVEVEEEQEAVEEEVEEETEEAPGEPEEVEEEAEAVEETEEQEEQEEVAEASQDGQEEAEGSQEEAGEDEDENEVVRTVKKRSILSDDSDSGPDDAETTRKKKKKHRSKKEHKSSNHHHHHKSKRRHEARSDGEEEQEEAAAAGDEQEEEAAPVEHEQEQGEGEGDGSGSDEVEVEDAAPRKKKSDLDEMLERQKKMRGRRRKKDEAEDLNDMDDVIKGMIEQMRRIAEEDRKANEKSVPAVQKLKFLPSVVTMLQKSDYHAAMIDLGMMGAIAEWMAPLPDRSLANIKIREQLIDALSDFGKISTDDLKSSGIGKAVMFLYKHPKETKENKRKLEKLIHDWSRPIFKLDDNFKQMSREERLQRDMEHVKSLQRRSSNSEAGAQSQNVDDLLQAPEKKFKASKAAKGADAEAGDELGGKAARPGEPGFVPRARVPVPSQKDYVIRPKSSVDASEEAETKRIKRAETRLDKHKKRFLEIQRSAKTSRAVSLSVSEGKS